MQLTRFRVQMFKCFLDSGWVELSPLTVLVGKNESGKTSLLKALHKFNPFTLEPYDMNREWPRGHRDERANSQIVCTVEFKLSQEEVADLNKMTDREVTFDHLQVTRDYAGNFEVLFPEGFSPERLHPNDIDGILADLPRITNPVGESFQKTAEECQEEARRLAREGRFSEFHMLHEKHQPLLQKVVSPGGQQPQHQNENNFISQFTSKLQDVAKQLEQAPSIHKKAHEYVIKHLPTFVYMDEYRTFQGMAWLDQVKQRKDDPGKKLTADDETLLTILSLARLDLSELVRMGGITDREQRQYDLDDAAATLTSMIENHWGQLRYEVKFGADGQQFFTWVKGLQDRALIRLEERSKGFQWFFSFDLLLMHQTRRTLKGCVILLDEPGLHLHPEGQRDLLKRLEEYAKGNTLIYTTHLPFMIDLQEPDRIRIVSETGKGVVITEDLTQAQPEGRLTLQAALGISGRTSFLVAEQNLVVEGVDDYWILTALSNLFTRCGEPGLPEDLMITAAGGASEVTYIATFMVGQELDVMALYDSDQAGEAAKDKFVKKWLARYKDRRAIALSLGEIVGTSGQQFSIEDIFTEDFYLGYVKTVYGKQLVTKDVADVVLPPGGQLVKRVEKCFEDHELQFNKGSIAKRLCADIRRMNDLSGLPEETLRKVKATFKAIREAMPQGK